MIRLMVLFVASLIFAPETNNLCIRDSCDYIEINDFGETGENRKQIVFWEWRKRGVIHVQRKITGEPTGLVKYGAGFTVIEYRTIQSEAFPRGAKLVVSHDYENSRVTVIFWDNVDNVMRMATAKWIVYTKCPDTEQSNIKIWAKGQRKGLTEPMKSN